MTSTYDDQADWPRGSSAGERTLIADDGSRRSRLHFSQRERRTCTMTVACDSDVFGAQWYIIV